MTRARDVILARRARFVAASMAALAGEACAAPPRSESPIVAKTTAPSSSTSTAPSSSVAAVVDSDGDGIPDSEDHCPTIAGVPSEDASKHGCPKVVVSVCLSIIVIERPHFAPGSAKLDPLAAPFLDAAASALKSHPEIDKVEVSGHCDAVEKPCPDAARATAVRDALVARGVDGGKLTTRAAGRGEPVADNATTEGRAQNRRAELKIPTK